uniref:Uncharacterized protein n=1 Tax=Scleropages formosus TaxID=113540 RepID=A0A8C9TAA6_SCLFO
MGWLDLSSVLIFLFVFLILVDLIKNNKAPKNFPPGPPWSLPFVGDLFRIDSDRIHLQMAEVHAFSLNELMQPLKPTDSQGRRWSRSSFC